MTSLPLEFIPVSVQLPIAAVPLPTAAISTHSSNTERSLPAQDTSCISTRGSDRGVDWPNAVGKHANNNPAMQEIMPMKVNKRRIGALASCGKTSMQRALLHLCTNHNEDFFCASRSLAFHCPMERPCSTAPFRGVHSPYIPCTSSDLFLAYCSRKNHFSRSNQSAYVRDEL